LFQSIAIRAAALLCLTGAAVAQVPYFNIDVGANALYPVPAAGFSAATAQAGVWTPVSMLAAQPIALVDINGAASPVTLNVFGNLVDYQFQNTGTPAGSNEENLMEDLQDVGGIGPPPAQAIWQFNNMPAGAYKVTFYSWAPDNRSYITEFNLTGGAAGPMPCGNAVGWPGFVLGTTYVQDSVTLAAAGTLTFSATTALGFGNVNGIQIEPGTPVPTTYCTAKTTSLSCSPSIGSTGVASATVGSGFVVNGTSFINNKSCLLFYGVSGQAATLFQGGILCVKAQIKRTPGTNTFGNPPPNDCSGVPAIDMNLFAVGGGGGTPLAALTVSGTAVDCQWWGRDPGFEAPNNTQLSNGLHYIVGP
jgi:hypothetical protein